MATGWCFTLHKVSCLLLEAKKLRDPQRIDQTIDWKGVVKRYYINKGSILTEDVEEAGNDSADRDTADDK